MELRTDRLKLADVFPEDAKSWAKRLHIKAGEIEYVRKGIPIDPADISIEDGERAAIRYVSTPRLDRDGEIMIPDGVVLDTFREAPTVLYAHDYSGLPIGKDIWIKPTKRGILAKTVYANHQLAQDVYDCVKDGFITSSSVGFIPVESVGMGETSFAPLAKRVSDEYGVPLDEALAARRIYTKWVLLEHSDCPVPSNAQSLNILVGKNISARLKKDMGVVEPEPPVDVPAIEPVPEPVEEPGPVYPEGLPPVEFAKAEGADFMQVGDVVVPACETTSSVPAGQGYTVLADEPLGEIAEPPCTLSELKAAVSELTARIEDVKSVIPAPVEPDEAMASVPYMLSDVLEHIKALEEKVDVLLPPVIPLKISDAQSADIRARVAKWKAEHPAPVSSPVDVAPVVIEPPAPIPAPAPPPDLKALVAEVLKNIDIKKVQSDAATLAISRLKGKVTAK